MPEDEEQDSAAKNLAKQGAKQGAKQVGKKAGKAVVKGLKVLIHIPGVKTVLIVIGLILLLMALLYSINTLFLKESSDKIQEKTGGTGLLESTVVIKDRHLEFNQNLEEIMQEYLKARGIDGKAVGLGKNLEVFKKFIEAEVVTSFPDLRQRDKIGTPITNNELQGIIQLNRQYSDGSNQLMEYMPFEEYKKELEKLGVDISNRGSLKNFLFLGDSFTVKMKEYGLAEQEMFSVNAEEKYTAKQIVDVLKTATTEQTEIQPTGITLLSGIYDIANGDVLGEEGTVSNINNMKELLTTLTQKYPNVPIYVQKVFPLTQNTMDSSSTNFSKCTKENIEQYNKLVEEYCKSNSAKNIFFIDTTADFIEDNGYLKQGKADTNGLNIAQQYYTTWINAIKMKIAQTNQGSSPVVEKEYKTKADATKAYDKIKSYFTLDEQFNLIVANMGYTETILDYSDYAKQEKYKDEYEYSYNINITMVDYKTVVQKYIMPYSFPMALLLISQNAEFASAVSDLSRNGKIVISVNDNLSTSVTVEKYDYHSDMKLEKDISYEVKEESTTTVPPAHPGEPPTTTTTTSTKTGESHPRGQKNQDIKDYYTRTIVTQSNDIVLAVTEVKSWIMDFKASYEHSAEELPATQDVIDMGSEEAYTQVEDFHGYLKELDDQIPSDANITSKSEKISEKRTNKKLNIQTTTANNKYTKTITEVLGKEERFLSLLKVQPSTGVFNKEDTSKNTKSVTYYKNYSKVKETAIGNITGASDWLFELLASTEKTQSFEEIMRYMLYMLTGKNYGVTSLDFSIYEPGDFIDATLGLYTPANCENINLSENVLKLKARVEYYANLEGISDYVPVLLAIMMQESGGNYVKTPDVFQCSESLGLPRNTLDTEASIKQGVIYYKGALVKANYDIDLALQGYNFGHGYIPYAIARGGYSLQTAKQFSKEKLKGGGDPEYVPHVKRYLKIEQSGINIIGDANEKLRKLFPNGLPKSESEAKQYMTTVTVEVINKAGKVEQRNLTVHKAIESDVKAIFQEIKNAGFKAYSIGAFSWRSAAASSSRSHHSYGIAIDINPTENYMIKGGKIISGSFWKPGSNEYSIPSNGAVVNAFKKRGWGWGGNWNSSKDYMHFSFTNK